MQAARYRTWFFECRGNYERARSREERVRESLYAGEAKLSNRLLQTDHLRPAGSLAGLLSITYSVRGPNDLSSKYGNACDPSGLASIDAMKLELDHRGLP
jgi:hypothetical protein